MMTRRKKTIVAVCVLIGVLFVAGITAVAVTNYGTASDPLVALSYIEEKVKPEIQSKVDSSISNAKTELSKAFDEKIAQAGGGTTPSSGSFVAVELTHRQVIRCAAGAEIVLRSGSATAYGGSSPRLVDTTDGTELAAAGADLTANHLYVAAAEGNGLRAASDNAVVMVRGSYTVHNDL